MATIDFATKLGANIPASEHAVRTGPHYVENTIDFSAAATSKGSALAANDIIQALDIPAGSHVISAGFEVITAQTGSGTLTVDLGVTGVDVDVFVDGFDYVAAAVGDYSQQPAAYQPVTFKSAGTIDVLIATLVTANTGGKLRVWAWYLDVNDTRKPGLTALKS